MKRFASRFALPLISATALSLLLLSACGPGSGDGSYAPTEDSVSTEGTIRFDPGEKTIIIEEPGPTARSSLISPCEISFVSLELSYDLVSAESLSLNGSSFERVSLLDKQTPVPGVPSGIFAIWEAEPQNFAGGVRNQIEIEIKPTTMTYRNKCQV